MPEFTRLLRTLSHLAPGQIYHRGLYVARRIAWERRGPAIEARYARRAARIALPRFEHEGLARVAALRAARREPEAALAAARDALVGRFHFLDRTRDLGERVAWHAPELDEGTRLWKTLLHEFDYGLDLAFAARATGDERYHERFFELFESWRSASPVHRPGADHDAWDPRAVATRLVHLSLAASLFELDARAPEAEPLGPCLAVHALYLREHLEWDIRANHLLRDAVGLVFAHEIMDCVPDAEEILRRQVAEQILPDGCHYERAPLYHAWVLQDLIEVRALLGDRTPAWLADAVARMAGFLTYLLPEDGELPLFGDTVQGEVDTAHLLVEAGVATPPGDGVPERASGLVTLSRGAVHAVVRAGLHGPDFQLGHAHADGLSFELSRGPQRVVTDTGTPTYDPGSARTRARSTAAHNTVQIDGEEQLEFWDSFRVGRRGRARVMARGDTPDLAWLWASHDGYRHLSGSPRHARLLLVSASGVVVLDAVTGRGRHRLRSALHLHPDAVDAWAESLGAAAKRVSAPLHERFNATREMTELYVEASTALPWVGGWAIRFDGSDGPCEGELHARGDAVHAQVRGGGLDLDVRWDLAAGEVEAKAPTHTRDSAT